MLRRRRKAGLKDMDLLKVYNEKERGGTVAFCGMDLSALTVAQSNDVSEFKKTQ